MDTLHNFSNCQEAGNGKPCARRLMLVPYIYIYIYIFVLHRFTFCSVGHGFCVLPVLSNRFIERFQLTNLLHTHINFFVGI